MKGYRRSVATSTLDKSGLLMEVVMPPCHHPKALNANLWFEQGADYPCNVIAKPPNAGVVDQRISEIDIPEDCPIVSVHRERKLYTIHGFTPIQLANLQTVFLMWIVLQNFA